MEASTTIRLFSLLQKRAKFGFHSRFASNEKIDFFEDPKLWEDTNNQRLFLDHFSKQQNIETVEQWYNVSTDDIRQSGGGRLIHKYKDFRNALVALYPGNK